MMLLGLRVVFGFGELWVGRVRWKAEECIEDVFSHCGGAGEMLQVKVGASGMDGDSHEWVSEWRWRG